MTNTLSLEDRSLALHLLESAAEAANACKTAFRCYDGDGRLIRVVIAESTEEAFREFAIQHMKEAGSQVSAIPREHMEAIRHAGRFVVSPVSTFVESVNKCIGDASGDGLDLGTIAAAIAADEPAEVVKPAHTPEEAWQRWIDRLSADELTLIRAFLEEYDQARSAAQQAAS